MSLTDTDSGGYTPDRKVADHFHKHPKTLQRWDRSQRLKSLGWPDPVYINGRRHRANRAINQFERNVTQAHLADPKIGENPGTDTA